MREIPTDQTDRLLFRRQFILGPRFVEELPSWKKLRAGPSICLTVHPDLNVYQAAHNGKSITLLGYILDPDHPDAGDADIVNGLLQSVSAGEMFAGTLQSTNSLGGRWILIVNDGQTAKLFNDPCGYRQVFYTDVSLHDELWCASQPRLIADATHLNVYAAAMEFIRSFEEGKGLGWPGQEYWWPGASSPYREIQHLLPNHYLDLKAGSSQRFWPREPLRRLSVEEVVARTSAMIRGLIQSASRRFELALTMTAGRDTRLVLAASREISSRLFYFTLMYWNMTDESEDVRIPATLLSRLELKHHVIRCPSHMRPEFDRIYQRNVTSARRAYGPLAQALYDSYPQERVCMKGNAIPIARARYVLQGMTRREARADLLVEDFTVPGNPFAIRAFEQWVTDAREASTVPIMDLFYWENIEGNWQAMSQLEWDIAQEVFVPYNCRALLANSLAVDERYRRPPRYLLFEKLTATMWPEVLSVPINPHDPHQERRNIRSVVREVLMKTGLYGFVPKRIRARPGNP